VTTLVLGVYAHTMREKYGPLRELLAEAASRGDGTIELSFADVDELAGGLPRSARTSRTWWANSSHTQALAWRAADWHVDMVSLDRERVRFTRGQVGGSFADRGRKRAGAVSPNRAHPDATTEAVVREVDHAAFAERGESLDARVSLVWLDAGTVSLDRSGKPQFPALSPVPGLYRLTLVGTPGRLQPRVYIGETNNLRRRLGSNYRNPGPRQQTSQRINGLLREHLAAGGVVQLAVAMQAEADVGAGAKPLDLTRKAARLLAENAVLVDAQMAGIVQIENLG